MDGPGPMATGLGVRDATATDAPAVVMLMREMADFFGETSTATEASVVATLGDDRCGALVAELDGNVVGVVAWFFFSSFFNGKRSAIVQDLSVTATCRDEGVGRALLQGALIQIMREDVAHVGIAAAFDNERAKHLYHALGFADDDLFLRLYPERP
jgi:ribosomal protein S18 acetylase RimI-like enzyme